MCVKKLSDGYKNLAIAYADSFEEDDMRDFLSFIQDESNFNDDINNIPIDKMYDLLKALAPKDCSLRTVNGVIGFWPINSIK